MKKFIRHTKLFRGQTALLAVLAFLLAAAGAAALPVKAEAASLTAETEAETNVEAGTEWTPFGRPDADGNRLAYSYDGDCKTLTITGTGYLEYFLHGEPFNCMEIDKVQFQDCKVIGGMEKAFEAGGGYPIDDVKVIDFTGLDTSEVTSMRSMFRDCDNLTALDLSSLDTSSVTDMSGMFWGCVNLTDLDLSSLDTSSVTDMSGMFAGCYWLTDLDLSSLDTGSVTDMSQMFMYCVRLTNLDLRSLDARNVTDMNLMFYHCVRLETLDLSGVDAGNVTNMDYMFSDCWNLSALNLDGFNTRSVTNMTEMFADCRGLTDLDLSSFDTANVTDMDYMFARCISLETLNLGSFDTSNVTDMSCMFNNCSNLEAVDLSSFNTSNVTNMHGMFGECERLITLDLSSLDTGNVTDMSAMFGHCSSLSALNLDGFNTRSVTNMAVMFNYCSNLEAVDLSSFNTSSVTDMYGMFVGCESLITLDLSSFDTGNVTDMGAMFERCSSLSALNLDGFNTRSVTNMPLMFNYCSNLEAVDLSSFNTSNVTNMDYMFMGCESLRTLDLSSFDTSNVTQSAWIFDDCRALEEIKAPHVIAEGWQVGLPAAFYDANIYESAGEYRTMTAMDASCAGRILKKYNGYDATAEPLPDAVQYVMYEHVLSNTGDPAQGIRLLEGALPGGMELQTDGKLSGIPMEAGEFVFTIEGAVPTVSGGDPGASGIPKTYKLTVFGNSDAQVSVTTDPGYEILQRVPDFTGDSVSGYTLVSGGAYDEFREVYIDGVKLTAGEDYTSGAGSTHIHIKSGTMERFSGAGVHTILVEFRATGTNALRCAVQNYRVAASSDDGRSEYPAGNDNTGSDHGDDSESADDDDDGSAADRNGAATTPIKYMVVKGDVLGRIARRNGVSLAQLLAWNPWIKNPDLIFPGQVIVVGYTGGGMEASALQPWEGAVVDIVLRGDSLYRIAMRNGVSLNRVAALNPGLMQQKYIYPGQKVRVK